MTTGAAIPILRTPAETRAWVRSHRDAGRRIGFAPTMGALHDGHLGLVRLARQNADVVIASIFVNPTQFAPGEDFDSYPRDITGDVAKLGEAGCSAAFCPAVEDMYPPGDATRVRVEDMSFILEGEFRPHFFIGVATVVTRLFIHVSPDVAVFGEKDYQQLQIIRRMTADLGFPIDIVGAPTAREPDGLAMSSRNLYLSAGERASAGAWAAALKSAADAIMAGASITEACETAEREIRAAGFSNIDYVTLRHADSLAPIDGERLEAGVEARLLGAARIGKTRLIDNLPVTRRA